jgi:hypothetical protein
MIPQVTILFIFSCTLALAQTCVETITPSSVNNNYQINVNGTVTDLQHGLMWTQCAVGRTWHDGKCSGPLPHKSWPQARKLADTYKLETFDDWRLPTIHELSQITELSCLQPAINLKIFPNTLPAHFWTGTEFSNNDALAWQIYFGTGENHTAKKSTNGAIRLIRTIMEK